MEKKKHGPVTGLEASKKLGRDTSMVSWCFTSGGHGVGMAYRYHIYAVEIRRKFQYSNISPPKR